MEELQIAPPKIHLERQVSLALILALIANFVVGVWFAAKLDARVATVEAWTHDNSGIERRLTALEVLLQANRDAIARDAIADRRKAATP